ncbi:GerW family sporulation protein [Aceticella autotrophica]|jgi:sporulation protein YtfJ|uniref:GerW family sporulation protein n=1 Tax=Aceticella autotrophica TaxID=2755338 RepID=A0A975AUC4_9THEO|nr:GerW family sporulation protein [Aceticella autotrophica]MDI6605382.1 GerW family sporulation protein [Thermoanaerobacteraceae bacterium]QSZ26477.1 GerW family sporulation protein [Aceticella autotrophica]
MSEHPIEGLMQTTMESLKDMIDVNTIVGDAVETPDGTVIIPISKVSFGFAAGGGEFHKPCGEKEKQNQQESESAKMPFSGGSGAGISLQPVAFMVVGQGQIRLLPVNQNAMIERIIDLAPKLIEELQSVFGKNKTYKKSTPITAENNVD